MLDVLSTFIQTRLHDLEAWKLISCKFKFWNIDTISRPFDYTQTDVAAHSWLFT